MGGSIQGFRGFRVFPQMFWNMPPTHYPARIQAYPSKTISFSCQQTPEYPHPLTAKKHGPLNSKKVGKTPYSPKRLKPQRPRPQNCKNHGHKSPETPRPQKNAPLPVPQKALKSHQKIPRSKLPSELRFSSAGGFGQNLASPAFWC